ncbi:MAG: alpha/beta fold hydrolase [Candidatus Sulfotelmatobacter sp.]
MLLPIPALLSAVVGLLSLLLFGASLVLLAHAYRRYRQLLPHVQRQQVPVREKAAGGVAVQTFDNAALHKRAWRRALADNSVSVPLAAGVGLLLFTFFGVGLVRLSFRSGQDEPRPLHSPVVRNVIGPAGENLHVEIFGRDDAPTLVFTHGWSTSSTEWYYAKRQLAGQFRLILWDLPGLGASSGASDGSYSLERMARDLHAVVASVAPDKPVVLVGHSIGGMINLTYCRLFPTELGSTVDGIVQLDTSYTNPVTTTKNASQSEALQKPVGEPLLHAMSALSPVVRVLNWLSYRNGTAHLMNAKTAFAGSETWGQVDLIARYGYESSPDVVARGTLAMFHWDAKGELARISVPVLVLVGQQDTTTLPSASVYMREHIPKAQLQAITPSAHYGLLEQNGRYNEAIARFASTCLKR